MIHPYGVTDIMADLILVDLVVGGVAGAVYGGAVYFKKNEGAPEPFDAMKFGGTVIIGGAVGVALASSGMQVTDSLVQNGLLVGTTMGFTALIENGLRGIYRMFKGGE